MSCHIAWPGHQSEIVEQTSRKNSFQARILSSGHLWAALLYVIFAVSTVVVGSSGATDPHGTVLPS